ncbi:MAG: helix-turn-helix transcriptional regulator [Methylococcaceae bacterium]
MNNDINWLLNAAEEEDNCIISVGGLVCRLRAEENKLAQEIPESTRRVAFAQLIELSRRKLRLSVEQLAEQADIDVAQLIEIEEGECACAEPRTVFKLAEVLKFPQRRLMELSGLAKTRDRQLTEATVRFAARSEPVNVLSDEEEEALQEYVKVLVESVEG